MKNTLITKASTLLIVVLALTTVSCQEEAISPQAESPKVIGTWEMKRAGFMDGVEVDLIFRIDMEEDNSFMAYNIDGELLHTGTYAVNLSDSVSINFVEMEGMLVLAFTDGETLEFGIEKLTNNRFHLVSAGESSGDYYKHYRKTS